MAFQPSTRGRNSLLAPILIAKSSLFLWPELKASTCSQVHCSCCCCCWTALRRQQQQLARHLRKANLGGLSSAARPFLLVFGLFGPFHRRLTAGAEWSLNWFGLLKHMVASRVAFVSPFGNRFVILSSRTRLGRSLDVWSWAFSHLSSLFGLQIGTL